MASFQLLGAENRKRSTGAKKRKGSKGAKKRRGAKNGIGSQKPRKRRRTSAESERVDRKRING